MSKVCGAMLISAGVLFQLIAFFLAFVHPLAAYIADHRLSLLWKLFAIGPPLSAAALLTFLVVVLRRERIKTAREKAE